MENSKEIRKIIYDTTYWRELLYRYLDKDKRIEWEIEQVGSPIDFFENLLTGANSYQAVNFFLQALQEVIESKHFRADHTLEHTDWFIRVIPLIEKYFSKKNDIIYQLVVLLIDLHHYSDRIDSETSNTRDKIIVLLNNTLRKIVHHRYKDFLMNLTELNNSLPFLKDLENCWQKMAFEPNNKFQLIPFTAARALIYINYWNRVDLQQKKAFFIFLESATNESSLNGFINDLCIRTRKEFPGYLNFVQDCQELSPKIYKIITSITKEWILSAKDITNVQEVLREHNNISIEDRQKKQNILLGRGKQESTNILIKLMEN